MSSGDECASAGHPARMRQRRVEKPRGAPPPAAKASVVWRRAAGLGAPEPEVIRAARPIRSQCITSRTRWSFILNSFVTLLRLTLIMMLQRWAAGHPSPSPKCIRRGPRHRTPAPPFRVRPIRCAKRPASRNPAHTSSRKTRRERRIYARARARFAE